MIKKKAFLGLILLSLCIVLVLPGIQVFAVDRVEGGYVGNDQRSIAVVWNFIKHFSYEQYYWAWPYLFTYNNNYYVDAMDFVYFCGHGSPWMIYTYHGSINLETAGYSSHRGYGTNNLEFIVFHSCSTIPSPLEVSNWWSPWISEPDDIFDGLHQALGFRTPAYVSSAPDISNYYGHRIRNNWSVLWSWFDAIVAEGHYVGWWWWRHLDEFGSVVLHPSTQGDTYGNFAPDPPENHTNLMIWYQH
jgi:hypothetical protein